MVRRGPDGGTVDVTPAPFNAWTRVHEHGGGSVVINGGAVWFSNFDDQRLYRQDLREGRPAPHPLSPTTELRYTDGIYDYIRDAIICVREDHTQGEDRVANTITAPVRVVRQKSATNDTADHSMNGSNQDFSALFGCRRNRGRTTESLAGSPRLGP